MAGARNLPITTASVVLEEKEHRWRQLTAKIAKHGTRVLSEPELALYEQMRADRGMDTVREAVKDTHKKLGITEERALVQNTETEQVERAPCLCGCGYIPTGKKSRFLPGHDSRYHAAIKKAEEKAAEAGVVEIA